MSGLVVSICHSFCFQLTSIQVKFSAASCLMHHFLCFIQVMFSTEGQILRCPFDQEMHVLLVHPVHRVHPTCGLLFTGSPPGTGGVQPSSPPMALPSQHLGQPDATRAQRAVPLSTQHPVQQTLRAAIANSDSKQLTTAIHAAVRAFGNGIACSVSMAKVRPHSPWPMPLRIHAFQQDHQNPAQMTCTCAACQCSSAEPS